MLGSRGDRFVIRPVQAEEALEVVRLITGILEGEFPSDQAAYGADDLTRLIETYQGPKNTFLVAVEDQRIIGTCGVKAEDGHTAILRRLFVDAPYRRRGIGLGLLREAIAFCQARGFREAVIRTSTRMEQAIRLCRSLGFEEDGRWTFGVVTLIRFRLGLISSVVPEPRLSPSPSER
jgi:GNAT superfamily N-acetyltransferase